MSIIDNSYTLDFNRSFVYQETFQEENLKDRSITFFSDLLKDIFYSLNQPEINHDPLLITRISAILDKKQVCFEDDLLRKKCYEICKKKLTSESIHKGISHFIETSSLNWLESNLFSTNILKVLFEMKTSSKLYKKSRDKLQEIKEKDLSYVIKDSKGNFHPFSTYLLKEKSPFISRLLNLKGMGCSLLEIKSLKLLDEIFLKYKSKKRKFDEDEYLFIDYMIAELEGNFEKTKEISEAFESNKYMFLKRGLFYQVESVVNHVLDSSYSCLNEEIKIINLCECFNILSRRGVIKRINRLEKPDRLLTKAAFIASQLKILKTIGIYFEEYYLKISSLNENTFNTLEEVNKQLKLKLGWCFNFLNISKLFKKEEVQFNLISSGIQFLGFSFDEVVKSLSVDVKHIRLFDCKLKELVASHAEIIEINYCDQLEVIYLDTSACVDIICGRTTLKQIIAPNSPEITVKFQDQKSLLDMNSIIGGKNANIKILNYWNGKPLF